LVRTFPPFRHAWFGLFLAGHWLTERAQSPPASVFLIQSDINCCELAVIAHSSLPDRGNKHDGAVMVLAAAAATYNLVGGVAEVVGHW